MIVVSLAQLLLVFNVTTLKVSVDAIADGLGLSASSVKTAIIVYSLAVAGLVMLGARIGERLGARRVFRATLVILGGAMALMALSRTATEMLTAQVIAGAASAALIPTLVVMIADHYRGTQRAQALGWLGATQAIGLVPAFLIAGYLATAIEWRLTFALLSLFTAAIYALSGKLRSTGSRLRTGIDVVGVALAASGVLLIGIGMDKLSYWGLWRAQPGAPWSFAGLSPSPIMLALGLALLHAFVLWSRKCRDSGRTPLIAPEVIGGAPQRSALTAIFAIGVIGAGLTFLLPFYIEIVQGRTSLHTALALAPLTSASFAAAIVVVRLNARIGARRIARYALAMLAFGLALLGATIRNDWTDSMVVLGLIFTGFGEGALATLLFKLLSTTVPRYLAGDVGCACCSTSFLGAGVGTALAATLLIGLLSSSVNRHVAASPLISADLKAELELDSVSFVSNDRLLGALARTGATQKQVDEAVRVNTEARLFALKASFFAFAGLALLAFIPAASVADIRAANIGTEEACASPSDSPSQNDRPIDSATPRSLFSKPGGGSLS